MSARVELEPLLERAATGCNAARQELLQRYEARLKRMLQVHMDRRVAGRFDPSDVLQEALLVAWQKLPTYLDQRPVAFYPWLRSIAWERLIELHRAHIGAQKRSVEREHRSMKLPADSRLELAARIAASGTSVSQQLVRKELKMRLAEGLEKLRPADREVLVLRYLEQLSVKEIAAVVGATEGAVKLRCFRAIERLQALLELQDPNSSSAC